ncbi:neuropeptide Y receptor type 1-like isoform X1 [Vespa mandarinia]|uniref:neuropeptide Y receptor type 1-like isoform X1 n=1 Tax=Vespa mandarinia TaxID=7446 RepID=UPI00161CA7D4|nr:neuropeptide Y receptor type 1-like isoform X1 [Vespa mandarinia]XP_035735401.1 neuropeptide Y receptor type 1-like isoform X1 [Vespa mandarinia]XP_035735402.1 neuropeptide Y receptor type 1-like isoform X1 [Vespa mandarinia]
MNDSWLSYEDLEDWSSTLNNSFWINKNGSYGENDEDLYDVPTSVTVILSICYGSISVLAIVGNSLVMWVVTTTRRMQNMTNFFIANLALADIIIGLFVIPFQFQAALLQRWNLPHFMCAFCPFVRILCVNVSVFTLTAIAVDRHRAILKPLSASPTKLKARIIIAGIWMLATALATPMALALRVIMIPENMTSGRYHLKPFCHNENMSENSMLTYRALLVFLQYMTPLSIISVVYARMARTLWGSRAPGNAEDSRDAAFMKNKKKVIKMLVIVVVLFAICWLPLQSYNVLEYTYSEVNQYQYINIIWFCCDWLAMSNSCCNPFVYGIYNEKFKREFQQRCPFRSRKLPMSPPTDSMDLDKTQSTRASIRYILRYDWRRAGSSGYPSFYRGVPMRESSKITINSNNESITRQTNISTRWSRNEQKNQCCPDKRSPSKAMELYVFSSGRHKHTKSIGTEELCL